MFVSGICTKPGERAIVYAFKWYLYQARSESDSVCLLVVSVQTYTIALSPGFVQIPLTSMYYRSYSWFGTDTTNQHTLSLSIVALHRYHMLVSGICSKPGERAIVYVC
jgi:hypothetical protein